MRSPICIFFYILTCLFLPFATAPAGETALVPCPMPVYVNGEPAEGEEGIYVDADGRYYADVGFLRRHIAPDFVTRTEDGAWTLRRALFPEDAVVVVGERAFLDLEKADFCLRVDPWWLEEGVFALQERFSPALEAGGARFERTGEYEPSPEDGWDAISPEGRAMWLRQGDWWLEDGHGLVWRYAPAEGVSDGMDGAE